MSGSVRELYFDVGSRCKKDFNYIGGKEFHFFVLFNLFFVVRRWCVMYALHALLAQLQV